MTEMTSQLAGEPLTSHVLHSDIWKPARGIWQRLLSLTRRPQRRLRLCESLPLGERRFVAVIEFENLRFLLGGTSASLVLLARLDSRSGASDPSVAQAASAACAPKETP